MKQDVSYLDIHGLAALIRRMGLPLKLGLWGLLLMAIVATVALTGELDDTELRWLSNDAVQDSSSNVRIFQLSTGDNNPTRYLQDLNRLVYTFKSLGARVVVAERPLMISPRQDHLQMIDSIQKSGIAILFENITHVPGSGYVDETYSRSVQLREGFARTFVADVFTHQVSPLEKTIGWYPSIFTGVYHNVSVSLAAAARFMGAKDSLFPSYSPARVTLGGLSVPVQHNGKAISLFLRPWETTFMSIAADRALDSDSLFFYEAKHPGGLHTFPSEAGAEVKGKVVLISWNQGYRGTFGQALVIKSLLNGRLITRPDNAPLLLTAIIIVLATFLSFKLGPVTAAGTILLSGAIVYLAGVWAFTNHLLLLNVAYPALASLLAAVVLPLAKIVHERR